MHRFDHSNRQSTTSTENAAVPSERHPRRWVGRPGDQFDVGYDWSSRVETPNYVEPDHLHMGLGSTAKKIQGISDKAEQMYGQVQELQERIFHLEEEVDDTHETVSRLEHSIDEQRALLLAIANEHGLDGEEILAEAAIDEAEADQAEADQAEADVEGHAEAETGTD